jgi:hypothetical protein
MTFLTNGTDSVKLLLNGKDAKEQISIKATGKLEIVLPAGWRYVSGKIKILNGEEIKTSKQITGETALKEFDLLQFLKANAVVGNHITLDLSVRTKESGTLATMKVPVVE